MKSNAGKNGQRLSIFTIASIIAGAGISLAALSAGIAQAADKAAEKVKVGVVTTLSTPAGALGVDMRDGFNLAIKHLGGKLGGRPAEVTVSDDQFNPDTGRQIVERYVKRDRVDFVTGIIYSNIMLAAGQTAFDAKTPYVSANAGPSQYAGKGCSPWFVSAAWQNDTFHEAAGQHATSKGYNNAYLMAPNYPAGQDALTGFKRFYKGKVNQEVYVKLGQLDFAAELAQLRAAKPDVVYVFFPGGMGINFIKQFVAAGLSRDTTLLLPGFSADQDIIPAVGESMLGLFSTAHWALDLDNAENRKFVADFEATYKRLPSVYAAQGYDTALLMDAAVHSVKGRVEDREAVMKALKTVKAKSVRGAYRINNNGYPVQNYYLRVVGKDGQGRLVNKTMGTVFSNHADAYAKECALK
jgi:branched-chain amino acid transport system substrate-binding protein